MSTADETSQGELTQDHEPSLRDLSSAEELQLLHQAREMTGPLADQAREQLFMLSLPIVEQAAQRYQRSLDTASYEDFVQDQKLKVLTGLIDRHDPEEGRFAAYVIATTRYNGLHAIRESQREIATLDEDKEFGTLKDRLQDTRESIEDQVVTTVTSPSAPSLLPLSILPPDERVIIEEVIIKDRRQTEVARHLGVSISTIERRKARALERLLESRQLAELLQRLKEEGDYESITSSSLVKILIERQQMRDVRSRRQFMAEVEAKRAQQEAVRLEKLQQKHEAIRRAKRYNAARESEEIGHRREKHQQQSAELETHAQEQEQSFTRRRRLMLQQLARERQERLPLLAQQFTPEDISVLPYLHLSDKEGSEMLGVSENVFTHRVKQARGRLGIGSIEYTAHKQVKRRMSRHGLALRALEHGIVFVLPKPPPMNRFTIRERQVASRLWQEDSAIARNLGITLSQVARDLKSVLKKTGAHNRTTALLIAHSEGFEPFPEELNDSTPEALKPFTKQQREVLLRLHLPSTVIAGELGTSVKNINARLRGVLRQTGHVNEVALALQLRANGIKFDIGKPKRPLDQLITASELSLVQCLDLSVEDIESKLGIPRKRQNNIVSYLMRKTGARTRVELVLMAQVYATEKTKADRPSKEERFFQALDMAAMPMEEARPLLQYATSREAEYIEAYYFSPEEVSVTVLAKRFQFTRSGVRNVLRKGLANIRAHHPAVH